MRSMEQTKGQGRASVRLRALAPYLAMVVGGLLLRGAFVVPSGETTAVAATGTAAGRKWRS